MRLSFVLLCLAPVALSAQRPARATFPAETASVHTVRTALASKRITCRSLVQQYLARIEALDKQGPAINSIVLVNPAALQVADSLDAHAAAGKPVGPLHCIPLIVKDNFETRGLQTTAGSLALEGWTPLQDATMVRQVKAAGAIVLAKSNLAEWAFTPYETVSSILPGYTRNPYALDRVTAGSSGGTAAAVAAGFGTLGLGTDTGNSIRGPSAHQALVGIRSTMGLTSRAGVVPLNATADVAGPMARSVADAVTVFDVIAHSDPADTVTAPADARRAVSYLDALRPGALRGARIGVLRQAYDRPTLDPEVKGVFERAVADLRRAGAIVLDTVAVDSLDAIQRLQQGGCNRFKADLERYLAARAPNAPVKTIDQILRSRRFHPTVEPRLRDAAQVTQAPEESSGCQSRERVRSALRVAVTQLMDSLQLDAMVYPTWSNPPRLIGDLNSPHGDNSQLFSPTTGFPAITVPMGYTRQNRLPAGVSFFGRAWSEARLISLAYDYEQQTRHWRVPTLR
ncbi:amidase family protein [Gemmatimonas phototrophica]|uniref:Amidase n=1 Tax=Gemmatimonas phototrophica TaxID=1379270 RepID=A0A143BLJ8_9BACT|nr:amidase family protein [Gemmatimonas phototrophica]AMW05483.1 amidase [Gemmatimonas phototrophica]